MSISEQAAAAAEASTATISKIPPPLALVTGGARGIGRATCILLARRGFDVAVNYRSDGSSAAAQSLVEEIEGGSAMLTGGGENGGGIAAAGAGKARPRALAFQADISVEDEVCRLFEEVRTKFGREPCALVNNAGILGPNKDERDVANMKREDLDAVFATNVYGPFYCCREFVRRRRREAAERCGEDDTTPTTTVSEVGPPAGKKRKVLAGGAIVNVSSGLMKMKGHPLFYAMSKGTIDTMMVGLAKSLPETDGIRINAVAPGTTKTDLVSEERADSLRSIIPMGRVGTPEEVAEGIAFLLDDATSSYCCGATIAIMGGR